MPSSPEGLAFTISAAERETGLSKDVLRMWERRYGFPRPSRDVHGERLYAAADVAKLLAIKRLMDGGMRPGKLIHLDPAALNAIADSRAPARREVAPPAVEHDVIALLKRHDLAALATALTTLLVRHGLQQFVRETLAPLNRAVGDAWMRGDLQTFEEHLYTEQVQAVLRGALQAFPRHVGAPRVLLTTLPADVHPLGPLMIEALLVPDGACCISLGTQTPIDGIRAAALALEVQFVAIAFSARFPVRQATEGLAGVRRELPSHIGLWASGQLLRRLRKTMPGIMLLPEMAGTLAALRSYRAHRDADAA